MDYYEQTESSSCRESAISAYFAAKYGEKQE